MRDLLLASAAAFALATATAAKDVVIHAGH
jgi:hypothetical protein